MPSTLALSNFQHKMSMPSARLHGFGYSILLALCAAGAGDGRGQKHRRSAQLRADERRIAIVHESRWTFFGSGQNGASGKYALPLRGSSREGIVRWEADCRRLRPSVYIHCHARDTWPRSCEGILRREKGPNTIMR